MERIKIIPAIDIPSTIARVEVIDKKQCRYVNYQVKKIELQIHDEGKTLKVLIKDN